MARNHSLDALAVLPRGPLASGTVEGRVTRLAGTQATQPAPQQKLIGRRAA